MTFIAFIFLGFGALGRISWFRLSLYLLAVAFCTWSLVTSLGTPRPKWTFLHQPKNATLLATQLREPDAIYAWIVPDGASVPVAVKMPWNEGMAAQMQQAMQGAKTTHGNARMRETNGRPEFYVSTVTAIAPKEK